MEAFSEDLFGRQSINQKNIKYLEVERAPANYFQRIIVLFYEVLKK